MIERHTYINIFVQGFYSDAPPDWRYIQYMTPYRNYKKRGSSQSLRRDVYVYSERMILPSFHGHSTFLSSSLQREAEPPHLEPHSLSLS